MNRNEYELIKLLIERDFDEKNPEDLKKIKSFLCDKLNRLREYEFYGERRFILLQSFEDFCAENFTKEERKYHIRNLGEVYASLNDTKLYKLHIFQTIGIEKVKLLSYPTVSIDTINLYESKLNKHNISMEEHLSNSETKELFLKAETGPKLAVIS